ncbi:MAG: HD domain-containing protein [Eubacteriales bacterium]|nr:HD domain-containing protein [Eubacteriales bacterium]MDY3332961.1 HD domain-containing protein [Gallibacter sp.]
MDSIVKQYDKFYYPSKEECFYILEQYETPNHVKLHCNAVGITGRCIGEVLNHKGLNLNIPLIESSGFLHDIARIHDKHEAVGADYLESIGLVDIARCVREHTSHKINPNIDMTDEIDVLCIADRVVLQSKFVGPKQRMEYIKRKRIRKFGYEAEDRVNKFIKEFYSYIEELEKYIDIELNKIIPDIIK